MTAQSDWLPMMIATGFRAPFKSRRRGVNQGNPWLAIRGRAKAAQARAQRSTPELTVYGFFAHCSPAFS
jgi:hypothetical protein